MVNFILCVNFLYSKKLIIEKEFNLKIREFFFKFRLISKISSKKIFSRLNQIDKIHEEDYSSSYDSSDEGFQNHCYLKNQITKETLNQNSNNVNI